MCCNWRERCQPVWGMPTCQNHQTTSVEKAMVSPLFDKQISGINHPRLEPLTRNLELLNDLYTERLNAAQDVMVDLSAVTDELVRLTYA